MKTVTSSAHSNNSMHKTPSTRPFNKSVLNLINHKLHKIHLVGL